MPSMNEKIMTPGKGKTNAASPRTMPSKDWGVNASRSKSNQVSGGRKRM